MDDSGYWSMSYNPRYGRGWWLSDLLDSDGLHIDARVFGRGERLTRPGGLTLPLYPFGQQQCQPRLPLRTVVDQSFCCKHSRHTRRSPTSWPRSSVRVTTV